MAGLEEAQRQRHQVAHEVSLHAEGQRLGHTQGQEAAQHGAADRKELEKGKANHNQHGKVEVGLRNGLVDEKLDLKRREQPRSTQHKRQQQQISQRRNKSRNDTNDLTELQGLKPALLAELQPWPDLHRHAGEMLGHLGQRQQPPADSRVEYHNMTSAHLQQDDEVVHVPVQNCGQAQCTQFIQPKLNTAC